jgi:hypothetical protein
MGFFFGGNLTQSIHVVLYKDFETKVQLF